MVRRLKEIVKNSFHQGFIYIFGSSVLSQVFGLLSSIFVIRYLEKNTYGYYVAANNYYSYFSIFVGLGLTSSILQFCCESDNQDYQNAIYRFSFLKAISFNLLLSVIIFITGVVVSNYFNYNSGYYLKLMAFLPFVVFCNNYFQTVFRVKYDNKHFAIANTFFSFLTIILNIVLTRIIGAIGLVITAYISNSLVSVYSAITLKKTSFFSMVFKYPKELKETNKKEIVNFSVYCAITNFASTVLILLDITLLSFIVKDSEILADYKVASAIPSACLFVSGSLITFFYPHIISNFQRGNAVFKRYLRTITLIFILTNATIVLILFVFSYHIILLVYGEKYLNIIPIFRILCLNLLIASSFRKLFGNIIAAMKCVKVNLIHSSIAGVINILLDIWMINKMGSIGAAISTTVVTSLITILEIGFLYKKLA